MTDPLIAAARFLESQLEWLRHATDGPEPYAVRAFAEIDWCAMRLRSLVNGPSEQKYLGPCGAVTLLDISTLDDLHRTMDGPPCEGDIYAPRGGTVGRCRTCGAEVAAADREAWLDGEVRAHAFRAVEISRAYPINIKTLRSWVTRGLLPSYWRTSAGLVTPWTEPTATDPEDIADELAARGPRVHYVGDALDLAAADAARRAGNQATRARRKDNAA